MKISNFFEETYILNKKGKLEKENMDKNKIKFKVLDKDVIAENFKNFKEMNEEAFIYQLIKTMTDVEMDYSLEEFTKECANIQINSGILSLVDILMEKLFNAIKVINDTNVLQKKVDKMKVEFEKEASQLAESSKDILDRLNEELDKCKDKDRRRELIKTIAKLEEEKELQEVKNE